MTAGIDWADEDEVVPPWWMPDWPPLDLAEVAALAALVRAALDAMPAADRLVLDLAWRAGRSSVRFDYGDRFGEYVVIASVADRDVVRVPRAGLGGPGE
ncbi:hypothetical protein SAMN05660657_05062 [Geodermatophilus amargosae]|uniref:Uncharacterized protein n=1 Tax=Geodermatophilus amargosae TaxID=1296565 RepID=A0A1I7CZ30_9ACTN|nr:hypothetical protein [Geodermatophilus amargosae]SFU04673.1 hypothetical protein SAMN05660657_05062 [Geodermatophilus amargosae]